MQKKRNFIRENGNNWIRKAVIVLVWLCIWQILSMCVGNDILLVGPVETLGTLMKNVVQASFRQTIAFSLGRILSGFLLGWLLGLILAGISAKYKWLEEFLQPVMTLMKAVPVASFVVLFLIWFQSGMLAAAVSFCMVLPGVYLSTLEGIRSTDVKLLEMAKVHRMSPIDRFFYIYRPALKPFWESSMKLSVGMSWKSGVAAEVIGTPDFSIGEQLYMSKIHLDTAGVLAWTVAIIVISMVCEKWFLYAWKRFLEWQPDCKGSTCKGSAKVSGQTTAGESQVPVLCIEKLCKAYDELQLFENFSAVYQPGEVYYFRTPSGSGKTTLFRMIAGLEQADRGSISGNESLAFSFQEDRLCETYSALKNVELITGDKKRAREYLLPLLEEEDIEKACGKLSGGMKRRVAVARAFAMGSRIVLLDEPYSGLDEENRQKVQAYIAAHGQDKIVLIATHV